jgi:hypothetical protein
MTHLTKQERGGLLVPSSLAMASNPLRLQKKTVFCIRIWSDRYNFVGSVSHNADKKEVKILYRRSDV